MEARNQVDKIKEYKIALPSLLKISKNKFHSKYHPFFFNSGINEMLVDPALCVANCIFDANNQGYELHGVLGKGAFGIVKSGFSYATNERVVIKIQNINAQIEYQAKKFGDKNIAREYVLNQMQIEDEILKLNNLFLSSIDRVNSFDKQKHYTVMKFIPGIGAHLAFKNISMNDCYGYFVQMADQVNFLHEHNFLHLDIWRENILIDIEAKKAMLHDFGCSAKLSNNQYISKLKGSQIPVEVMQATLNNQPCVYSTYSDVFALGMTFYELIYNDYYEYTDPSINAFIERYSKRYQVICDLLDAQDDALSKLIRNMISVDINVRPSAKEVLVELIKLSQGLSDGLSERNHFRI